MYLHLGNQVIALQKSVLGVFDMDTATWSHRTRETLEKWEQAGQVENAAGDGESPVRAILPKPSGILRRAAQGVRALLARQRADLLSVTAQHRNII